MRFLEGRAGWTPSAWWTSMSTSSTVLACACMDGAGGDMREAALSLASHGRGDGGRHLPARGGGPHVQRHRGRA
jgi:hypothetical protein